MEISIVIVNWNSVEFTKECLASIRSFVRNIQYEVIMIDNASQDGSCKTISEGFPWVKVVGLSNNIGFARGNNLGVNYAKGEAILFLNPDTRIIGDAVSRMLFRLNGDERIGAVGCRLLNGDLTLQDSCVQAFPNISNQILGLDWLKQRFPKLPMWGMRVLFSDAPAALSEVDAVSGACLMVRRSVFDEVGGFSVDYFMYAEEMDLCYKIRAGSWKVCYVADAEVVHYGGQCSKKRSRGFADVVMRESVFVFFRKFRGSAYAYSYRLALLMSAVARLAVLAPLLAIPEARGQQSSARLAFGKWRMIASWALGLEAWIKVLGKESVPPT